MINFQEVSIRNFLSFGDTGVVIKLDRSPTTLITGTNGVGKSSIAEAITFGMFGKSFRGINKPDLVNTTNQKGCLIVLKFMKNEVQYVVTRGIKPNIFTIEKDGVLLQEEADVKDFQEVLDEILGFTYADYIKTILIGNANYKPIMQLTMPERRAFVDSMLNVGIYTTMSTLNKARLSDWKAKRDDVNTKIDFTNSMLLSVKTALQKVKEIGNDRETELRDKIEAKKREAEEIVVAEKATFVAKYATVKDDLQVALEKKSELISLAKSYVAEKSRMEAAHEEYSVALQYRASLPEVYIPEKFVPDLSIKETISSLKRELTTHSNEVAGIKASMITINSRMGYFKTHENCDTCEQAITKEHSGEILAKAKSEVVIAMERHTFLTTAILALDAEIKSLQDNLDDQLDKEKSTTAAIAKSELARLEVTNADKHIKSTLDKYNSFTIAYDTELAQIAETVKKLLKEIEGYEAMIEEDNASRNTVTQFNNDITIKENQKRSVLKEIETTEAELAKFISRDDGSSFEKDIKKHQLALKALQATVIELDIRKKVLDASTDLLKDTGIKASVVKMYIPVLNNLINNYLEKMGASYQIVLDENFNDSIKGRYKDEFSYKSLSQGERQRIDLAALFACRKVSQISSGTDTNLLILDEVGDSSMDFDGIESLFQIVEETCKDKNVFFVSHRIEMQDKCRSVIRLTKQNGFSKIS